MLVIPYRVERYETQKIEQDIVGHLDAVLTVTFNVKRGILYANYIFNSAFYNRMDLN